ncbi:MAG: ankyrin repeat domain-containing protein, partial [Acidobacteriota bacterium]
LPPGACVTWVPELRMNADTHTLTSLAVVGLYYFVVFVLALFSVGYYFWFTGPLLLLLVTTGSLVYVLLPSPKSFLLHVPGLLVSLGLWRGLEHARSPVILLEWLDRDEQAIVYWSFLLALVPFIKLFVFWKGEGSQATRRSVMISIAAHLLAILVLWLVGRQALDDPSSQAWSYRVESAVRDQDLTHLAELGERGVLTETSGRDPVFIAFREGKSDSARWLLENGHSLDSVEESLFDAIDRDDPELVSLVLAHGGSVDSKVQGMADGAPSGTVLAARLGAQSALETLLAAGPDLEISDWAAKTALHHAVERRRVEAVHSLLEAGADPNARGRAGLSPLELAIARLDLDDIARQDLENARLLLQAGADPRRLHSRREQELHVVSGRHGHDLLTAQGGSSLGSLDPALAKFLAEADLDRLTSEPPVSTKLPRHVENRCRANELLRRLGPVATE